MASPHLFVDLDVADPAYAPLAALAHRLDVLLNKPTVRSDANIAATLDEFLGALYALIFAHLQDFVDRPPGTPIDVRVLQERSAHVRTGRVRLDGKWMAGFHFNSALLRLAAVYHRALKVVTGEVTSRLYVDDLLRKLEPKYRAWAGQNWSNSKMHQLHSEVNDIKHSAQGLFGGRDVTYVDAVAAFGELLELLEAWPGLR